MNYFIIFLMSMFFFEADFIMADIRDSVVKVESSRCGVSERVRKGSGFLIKVSGDRLVLTSDHVVYSSNTSFCHRIWHPKTGWVPVQLRTSDWGTGLATLEFAVPGRAFSFDKILDPYFLNEKQLVSGGATRLGAVNVIGFPYDLEGSVSVAGALLTTQSGRRPFAQAFPMIEIVKTHGEFGMSGGPVEQAGEVIGILSHQVVAINPNAPSEVVSWENKVNSAGHLLAIPSSVALAWLKDAASRSAFRELAIDQWEGIRRVSIRGLEFKIHPDTRPRSGRTLPMDGGDGAGIGGNDNRSLNEVELEYLGAGTEINEKSDWISNLISRVRGAGRLSVDAVLTRDLQTGALSRFQVNSLAELFQRLGTGNSIPIFQGTGVGDSRNAVRQAKVIQQHLSQLNPGVGSLRNALENLLDAVCSDSVYFLNRNDFESVLTNPQLTTQWDEWFELDLFKTTEIMESIQLLRRELRL